MHAMDPQQRPSEREREMRAGISTFFVTALCGGLAIGSTASAAAPDQTGREIRSEEHTSELQSLMRISYAVFCLKKKIHNTNNTISSSTHVIRQQPRDTKYMKSS